MYNTTVVGVVAGSLTRLRKSQLAETFFLGNRWKMLAKMAKFARGWSGWEKGSSIKLSRSFDINQLFEALPVTTRPTDEATHTFCFPQPRASLVELQNNRISSQHSRKKKSYINRKFFDSCVSQLKVSALSNTLFYYRLGHVQLHRAWQATKVKKSTTLSSLLSRVWNVSGQTLYLLF